MIQEKAHELATWEIRNYETKHGLLPDEVKSALSSYRHAESAVFYFGLENGNVEAQIIRKANTLYAACAANGVSLEALILGQ